MEMCVHRRGRLAGLAICAAAWLAAGLRAQPNPPAPPDAQGALTWAQVKQEFEAANPSLRAGQLNLAAGREVIP